MNLSNITCLFIDIGGVLLSNGWDHAARARAARVFGLQRREMEERHRLVFDTYERGRMPLEDYLAYVVFNRPRPFTPLEFRQFMFMQSRPCHPMLHLVRDLKDRYRLKVVAVSNEGRELTVYRVQKFRLYDVVDIFVSSCFVGMRKPDLGMFRYAVDIAQASPARALYIENTPLFAKAGEQAGLRSLVHRDHAGTRAGLAALGLS